MGITPELITGMVIVISIIALALMALLTVQIYSTNQPKQRASVEPEVEDHNEIT